MSVAISKSRIPEGWLDQSGAAVTQERSAPADTNNATIRRFEHGFSSSAVSPLCELSERETGVLSSVSVGLHYGAFLACAEHAIPRPLVVRESSRHVGDGDLQQPSPEARRRALDLLDEWLAEPDPHGAAYWDEFERDVLAHRLGFRVIDP